MLKQLVGVVNLRPARSDHPVTRLVETWVFHRWQTFKNNPRTSSLILRAILVVATFGCFCTCVALLLSWPLCELTTSSCCATDVVGALRKYAVLLRDCKTRIWVPISVVTAVASVYWSLGQHFAKQWEHCNGLYRDFLKCTRDNGENKQKRDRLANAVAQSLVVCDMWAHRTFAALFRAQLEKAILHAHQESPSALEILVTEINSGMLPEDRAYFYLSAYGIFLEEKTEYNTSTDGSTGASSATP
jgi:hypothetical protein